MWSWSQEHALGQVLLSPHGVYKELTCEFLASMSIHSLMSSIELSWTKDGGSRNQVELKEEELQRVWATIAEEGYSSSRSKAAQIRSPVLEICHKALANTFFARKATGTINEGEVKLLDMGIKPIISRTRMGRRSEEIGHTQGTHASP
ncbi:unnamed protein product [Microthlaspi erraticum]|uniref:Arabidopsis retrotransposon Orf1 C-terminal domain-containing protein n=1 Tax=Microthlaspi erraticum TaxID=1685480 RepID=A0A6D2JY31_9BRAS|nr:unnamed protein product [Microthlaspi erraticum]